MTLYELGCEYRDRAIRLGEHIQTVRKLLPTTTGNDLVVLKRRILSLYHDAAECRRVAEKLMNYYEGSERHGSEDI